MKKIVYILPFVFFLGACKKEQRCDTLQYTYHFPQELANEYPYLKIYKNDEDFFQGENAFSSSDSTDGLAIVLEGNQQFTPFIDVRKADGTNSWSNQDSLSQLIRTQVLYEQCRVNMEFLDMFSFSGVISSSPTYVHLCLRNNNQDGGNKTWQITKIYNEKGMDVTREVEWACFKSLRYTFYKGGKGAKLRLSTAEGQQPCTAFKTLFANGSEVFATYSLEKADQSELRITIPALSDTFAQLLTYQIVHSTFNQLVINITNVDGQTGQATLTPISYEE